MIELRHLRTLRAIARQGSLARAAAELAVTQSALSHQLRDLEQLLGLKLMNRRLSPIVFSDAGKRLLELADDVLGAVDEAERDLARLARAPRHRLHIVLECHSCTEWLLPALTAYRHAWPRVELDLRLGATFDPWPGLSRGEVDLVVTTDPKSVEGVTFQPLFRCEVVLIVPNGHRLSDKPWVSPADLAEETLVSYPVELERLDIHTRFLEPAGVTVRDRRFAELTLMVGHLVACGQGVAALPRFTLHGMTGIGIVALRLGEAGLWGTLNAAFRETEREAPHLTAFLQSLRQSSFETLRDILPV